MGLSKYNALYSKKLWLCATLKTAHRAIRDIGVLWIQTLKMTLSGASHDSWSMLYGGVLTGGLLKETEENCIPNCIPRRPIYIGLKDS